MIEFVRRVLLAYCVACLPPLAIEAQVCHRDTKVPADESAMVFTEKGATNIDPVQKLLGTERSEDAKQAKEFVVTDGFFEDGAVERTMSLMITGSLTLQPQEHQSLVRLQPVADPPADFEQGCFHKVSAVALWKLLVGGGLIRGSGTGAMLLPKGASAVSEIFGDSNGKAEASVVMFIDEGPESDFFRFVDLVFKNTTSFTVDPNGVTQADQSGILFRFENGEDVPGYPKTIEEPPHTIFAQTNAIEDTILIDERKTNRKFLRRFFRDLRG